MTKKPCTHEYLAAGATGKVLICRECGVVHLHLQNLSLHFDVEQFAEFTTLMTAASKKLGSVSQETAHKRPALTLIH